MSETDYPLFVTTAERRSWDAMSPERRQQYLDAVPYILGEYPGEKMSVALIGTVLTFGG